ncbi:MAG: hypothetical protein JHD15_23330 [Phenylobacterium sp.]|uniref:hypothetical protein n=1 Tax=Phenylobacterium sp. TaxID=1871053 RepID=UPI001A1BBA79|nr:hypothetical protein [Phenylobacterium sp.]MBJ7413270.1 hypothetical protein [Phenylobacterium sp.]
MQTFRAYLQDAAGTITWAAWIEAAHFEDARGRADALCAAGTPTVDLWSSSERKVWPAAALEAV